MNALLTLSATEAARAVISGTVSARELTDAYLERIESVEPRVQSFLTVLADDARQTADALDIKRANGETLPALAGVPIALKDNLCTTGVRTTAGSRILDNFIPPYDATVVSKLKAAGAVFVGKANLDEFAMGSSTENSGYHTSRNPWDLERVPGGSSGGSAAAVAAQEALLALGSDTGGSIRQPAALCGVVGMKPTYGLVSRYGLIAYASSLDQIGPLGRTVKDCAFLLGAIAGHDPHDSTSVLVETGTDYLGVCGREISGLKVGIPKEYFGQGVEPEIAAAVRAAINKYTELGAIVEECSLPTTDYALAAYYIVAPAECSSNLARFDGMHLRPWRCIIAKDCSNRSGV